MHERALQDNGHGETQDADNSKELPRHNYD